MNIVFDINLYKIKRNTVQTYDQALLFTLIDFKSCRIPTRSSLYPQKLYFNTQREAMELII